MTKKQILIAEDEGLIAADIQTQLERSGYQVPAIASSGEEALLFARSQPFDLALMDIRLRGEIDGIAAARILRDELGVPVVYLTAYSDPDTLERAQTTVPAGFLVKPCGEATLRSTVHMCLYRREVEQQGGQARAGSDGTPVRLTTREREVLRLVAEGLTAKEIGERIHVAQKTVEFHKYNVMRKTSARSTADLTRFAIRSGIAQA